MTDAEEEMFKRLDRASDAVQAELHNTIFRFECDVEDDMQKYLSFTKMQFEDLIWDRILKD